MRVLGIDPGIGRMGAAVVERQGSRLTAICYELIETPPIAVADRLLLIDSALSKLITLHQPTAFGIEKVIFAANKTTAFDVAKAAGVAMLAAGRAGLTVVEITPPEVKQAVVGVGNADKRQVQFMVQRLLGLEKPPKPDDVSDALAVAIAIALRARV
jgi:crossover junction endodeoxyribonuclease RuvC